MKNELDNKDMATELPQSLFRLTPDQMKVPELVINDFFEKYKLKSLRIHLQEWLLNTQESELPFFIAVSRDIEKILEAVFIMNKNRVGLRQEEHISEHAKEDIKIEDEQNIEESNGFNIEYNYLHLIDEDPISCLSEVFEYYWSDKIKLAVDNWKEIAVCSDGDLSPYFEIRDRKQLYFFCKKLQHLIEALYVLVEVGINEKIVDGKFCNPNYFLFLKKEEMQAPYSVIEDFRKIFPVKYARTELWYLLDTIIKFSEEKEIRKENIMWQYEMFLCIIEATYLLDIQDEQVAKGLEYLQDLAKG